MNDTTLITKLIIIFLATLVFIKIIIRAADKIGLVDIPNHRSVHKNITPRGAGIGMILAIIISDISVLNNLILEYFATYLAIFLVFIIGVLDDHRDTTPKTKFYVIFVSVLLLSYNGLIIDSLGNFFGYHIDLGWFAIPFTMFAVAGFTNALNLSDGLDGLAGSLSVVILLTLCYIGYEHQDFFIVSIGLSFVAAIMAFMLFNWNPAKIFMGDSGSLTLGFVISLLSIKSLNYIDPTSILFIAAIPILDTLIVMVRRTRTGFSIFTPDKLHIHHIILRFFNGNVQKTVILLALFQIGFSLVGIGFSNIGNQPYRMILFIVNAIILYVLLNGMLDRLNKKNKS